MTGVDLSLHLTGADVNKLYYMAISADITVPVYFNISASDGPAKFQYNNNCLSNLPIFVNQLE